MKVSVAAVISIDGKMTRHDDPDVTQWASREDHEHFMSLLQSSESIVMGSTTYELMRGQMRLRPENFRVVLTSRPDDYADQTVPGQLEFHHKSPAELVQMLAEQGKETLLIVGGGQMITDFLKAGLVDTLYITVEPKLFGGGKPLITEVIDPSLKLLEQRQLNDYGSMLLTYQVTRSQ